MDLKLVEMPSLRIATLPRAIQNGAAAFSEIKEMHGQFLTWEKSIKSRAPEIIGHDIARDNRITHGARWKGAWRGDHSVVTEFELCLFLANEAIEFSDAQAKLNSANIAKEFKGALTYTTGGLYAVARVEGAYSNIKPAAEEMLHNGLPSLGLSYEGEYWMEIYRSRGLVAGPDRPSPSISAVAEKDQVTYLYCPVVKAKVSKSLQLGYGTYRF